MERIRCITLTILTESPVALSNDQGLGNYTPIKKYFFKDGKKAMTSVATITYELRRKLMIDYGWNLSDVVLKKKNLYINQSDIESMDKKKLESDIFGYLIPGEQISKTSPLRIIPFISINNFKNDTQTITNKGFLDIDLNRKYFDDKNNQISIDDIPRTQALANEELFGDYYTYTVTIELDRIGVNEFENGKLLSLEERTYIDKDIRLGAVKDIIDALTKLTRDIRHQKIFLRPLAIFGGVFEDVVPYFWNSIEFVDGKLNLDLILETIEEYDLDKKGLIASVSKRIATRGNLDTDGYPRKTINGVVDKLYIGEDNNWYLGE